MLWKKYLVKLIKFEDSYNVKLMGRKGGKYTFTIGDGIEDMYSFEYYFDKEQNTVILKEITNNVKEK